MELLIVLAAIFIGGPLLVIFLIGLLDRGTVEKFRQELQQNGVPEDGPQFWYKGGHPEYSEPALVYMWRDQTNIMIAPLAPTGGSFRLVKVFSIPAIR